MERGDRGRSSKFSILLPCLAVIITCLLSGFGFSQGRQDVQELLTQRTNIIQLVWYSQMTPAEGEAMLRKIETHPLLAQDVAWLREAEEGMDFAYVCGMEVLSLNKTSKSAAGICYQAEIQWDLSEYGNRVKESRDYRIRLKQQADKLLLSEFQVLGLEEEVAF